MSQEQIEQFSAEILISDVLSYIEIHKKDYEEWLRKKKRKEEKNDEMV